MGIPKSFSQQTEADSADEQKTDCDEWGWRDLRAHQCQRDWAFVDHCTPLSTFTFAMAKRSLDPVRIHAVHVVKLKM